MRVIDIKQVLADIESGRLRAGFQLTFVRSTGARIGSLCTIAHARKGAPNKRTPIKSGLAKTSPRAKPMHKFNDTIPIVDMDNDKYMSPLISHIVEFDGKKVRH